jgi:hypothetical protein
MEEIMGGLWIESISFEDICGEGLFWGFGRIWYEGHRERICLFHWEQ